MPYDSDYQRARLQVNAKSMSFKSTVKELELQRLGASEYGRFPIIIIDEWMARAGRMDLYEWIKKQVTENEYKPDKIVDLFPNQEAEHKPFLKK